MAEKRLSKNVDFPELLADGENPNGTRLETAPDGVSRGGVGEDYFRQYNWEQNVAGERWGRPSAYALGPGTEALDSGRSLSVATPPPIQHGPTPKRR